MSSIFQNKNSNLRDQNVTVMIETPDTGTFHYATMRKINGDDLNCGSDYPLKPGTPINIRFDSPPNRFAPNILSGEVLRCEERDDDNVHNFELGIKIIEAVYD